MKKDSLKKICLIFELTNNQQILKMKSYSDEFN